MYRDAVTEPRVIDRDPRSLVEEVGLVEPGEDVAIQSVERTPTAIAKVRVEYAMGDEPAGENVEVLVDAPTAVADKLAGSQCVPEREISGAALEGLPTGIRRKLREAARYWRSAGGRAIVRSKAQLREEDVLRIEFRDGSRRRRLAWLGTAPLRVLGTQTFPRLGERFARAARVGAITAAAFCVGILVAALAASFFVLPFLRY